MSLFGQRHAFSDVDAASAGDEAAAYLEAAAEQFRARRLESLDRLALVAGSTFLDAGCGLGEIVLEAAARVMPGGRAIGVDLSEALIERARAAAAAQASTAQYEVGDLARLGFPDSTFDAVRCERVFQHLDDDDADAATAEMVRVAKRGGRIYLVDAVHIQHVLDCADVELFEAILAHFVDAVRDPYAGIRLARRLQSANATLSSFEVVPVQFSFPTWRQALGIDQQLEWLIAGGQVTPERAAAFMKDLARRDADGTFYAAGVGYRALALKG